MEITDVKIRKMLSEGRLRAVVSVTIDDNFAEDLDLESLDLVDLIMGVETAFDIKLDMADAKNTKTIRDLINFIREVKPELCAQ